VFTFASCIGDVCEGVRKGTEVTPGRKKMSLVAEFITSSRSHKMMFRKLALKTQRKIHILGFAVNNTTTKFHRRFDAGYVVRCALCGSMNNSWYSRL
jgi:hypothetical protein